MMNKSCNVHDTNHHAHGSLQIEKRQKLFSHELLNEADVVDGLLHRDAPVIVSGPEVDAQQSSGLSEQECLLSVRKKGQGEVYTIG